MNIPGLDYNTQREKLIMPEYGREVQKMVDYCMTIADRKERLNCAYTIIDTMMRMNPQLTQTDNYEQKLWDQLAVISDFKLDIDWPVDVSKAKVINEKPQPVKHETGRIPVRHYGRMVFELFDKLKTMEPGPERDELTALTANQMKRDWHASPTARYSSTSTISNLSMSMPSHCPLPTTEERNVRKNKLVEYGVIHH